MTEKGKYSLHSMDNIKRAKTDKDYLGELIIENEALIRFTINKYVGEPEILTNEYLVEMDDLVQIGRIAFMKAIDGFDCDRGVLFTSYVPTAIIRDVRHFLRDNGRYIKLPRPAHSLYIEICQYLSNIHYNEIDFDEIADALERPVEDVYKAWCLGSRTYELDRPITSQTSNDSGAGLTWTDVLKNDEIDLSDNVVDQIYLENVLNSVKESLDEFECGVLEKKIKGDLQSDIAREYDVTQMKISRTVKKIREMLMDEFN